MVRQIERLGPELNGLALSKLELSCDRHVYVDLAGALSIDVGRAPLPVQRPAKSCRIQILSGTFFGRVHIREKLIRPTVSLSPAQTGVRPGCHSEIAARLQTNNA